LRGVLESFFLSEWGQDVGGLLGWPYVSKSFWPGRWIFCIADYLMQPEPTTVLLVTIAFGMSRSDI
jgi:hypothetical protein